ncbi:hypothetical protein ORV05_00450 [Amycolatopsis cynarae]|uniref:Uncharacterized protein n=1 Tax=Amycolatopsis cynarae TaxID=2995223 RepID=A0ABY7B1Y9_9PSEU|nr:hypothetical protein [Amycolatopsis sp. HUAS 11-8]WAL66326.1 hypothetical protein ORV05_00450 [Amycolatopsis sp. HUAS 11-8]
MVEVVGRIECVAHVLARSMIASYSPEPRIQVFTAVRFRPGEPLLGVVRPAA